MVVRGGLCAARPGRPVRRWLVRSFFFGFRVGILLAAAIIGAIWQLPDCGPGPAPPPTPCPTGNYYHCWTVPTSEGAVR